MLIACFAMTELGVWITIKNTAYKDGYSDYDNYKIIPSEEELISNIKFKYENSIFLDVNKIYRKFYTDGFYTACQDKINSIPPYTYDVEIHDDTKIL